MDEKTASGPPVKVVGTGGRVPVRTILTTIGLVAAAAVAVLFVMRVERVLIWMLVALFSAVVLYPPVDWVQRRVVRRRSIATLLVFLVVLTTIGALLSAFAVPLAQEGAQLAGQLPGLINDARAGRGPVGSVLERTNAVEFVQNNEARIREYATGLGTPALNVLRGASTAIVATVTIFVLAYLTVLEGRRSSRAHSVFSLRSVPSGFRGSPMTVRKPLPAISPAICSSVRSAARSPMPCSRSPACLSPA